MKKILTSFILVLAFFFAPLNDIGAVNSVLQDGVDGWNQLTAIPNDPSLYYFAFLDKYNDLMLELRKGNNNPNNALFYMQSKNPLLYRSFLWTLEPNSGNYQGMYSMRNVEYPQLLMQTEWGKAYLFDTNDQPNPCEWTAVNMRYNNDGDYWTFENGKYPESCTDEYKGYLGSWEGINYQSLTSGKELAGNKLGDQVGRFLIYAILKSDAQTFVNNLADNASEQNPADLSLYIINRDSHFNGLYGWTTSGWVGRNMGNSYDGGSGFFEPSDWNAGGFTCTMTQAVSGIPNGRYQLKAAAQASTGCTLVLKASDGDNAASVTLQSKGDAGSSFAPSGGWEWINTGIFTVSSHSFNINVTTTASAEHNWGNIDGFRLLYLGPINSADIHPGDDVTDLYIVNPGFEVDNRVVNVNNGETITGWTVNKANDTGVFSPNDGNHTTVGFSGSYIFNHWYTGTPITQNIGVLPQGVYQLSVDVATGNAPGEMGTVYLNANEAVSTGYASSNNRIMGREYLVFASDGITETTIGLRGGQSATVSSNGAVIKGDWNENGYWWFKADNFHLVFLGKSQEDISTHLATIATANAPFDDVTDVTDYTQNYNVFAALTGANSLAELTEAVNFITNEYDDYLWNNASVEHPVDVTQTVIKGAECTSNEYWPGSGRTTGTGNYYDGSQRTYFTQNHESGPARAQDVNVFYEGAYLLRTVVRPLADASYATISFGELSTTTKGIPSGVNDIGNGWTYNDIYYGQSQINQSKTISINLSNINVGREADCGEMHLYYIGRNTDFVYDGIHKFVGMYDTAPMIELTDEKPVADIRGADMSGANVLFTNPNGIVFAKAEAQLQSIEKNIVIGTLCNSLQLESAHPFINPYEFTASEAVYNLTENYLAGGQFATLTIPFNASSLPGEVFMLDKPVNLVDGNVYGTSISEILANKPVLVKAAGNYSAQNVTVTDVQLGQTFENGLLVGTYTPTSAPVGAYVLQNHTAGEGARFYIVANSIPNVGPFRAYIKPQDSFVKSIRVNFDLTDSIRNFENDELNTSDKAELYSISGTKLTKIQKGMNILRFSDGTVKMVYVK